MKDSTKTIDMLHGPLTFKIIMFALPIALSNMLQQLFHAADTSVVGHFADANALAAVGTNGEIVALLVAMSSGLSVGINVLLAKYIGEKNSQSISDALHTSILLALILGLFGGLSGQVISAPLLNAIHTPDTVLPLAITYLRLYFLGYPFLMLFDFSAAILRAKGDSRRPFIALTISGCVNVVLNLFFVIVCNLGVVGVAIATDISTAVSALLVLIWLHKEASFFHFSFKKLCFRKAYISPILTIGIPSAIQGAVFCFANIFVQATVNSFGAIATAGSTIAMNFEYFGYYMITAYGQTATTFSSQNFAAGKMKRCKQTLLISLALSVLFSAAITIPLTIWRFPASMLFSSEKAVIESACLRIMLILIVEPICSFYEIPAGVLRGSGHSAFPAIVTIIGTCLLRIIWIFTVFHYYHTQESLFIIFPISWVITIIFMSIGFLIINPFKDT